MKGKNLQRLNFSTCANNNSITFTIVAISSGSCLFLVKLQLFYESRYKNSFDHLLFLSLPCLDTFNACMGNSREIDCQTSAKLIFYREKYYTFNVSISLSLPLAACHKQEKRKNQCNTSQEKLYKCVCISHWQQCIIL